MSWPLAIPCSPVGDIQAERLVQYVPHAASGEWEFGDEARVDPRVAASGLNNWNVAIFKKTKITEATDLEFRAEAFNLTNRVQFALRLTF
jgi:hypothetical protein